MIGRYAKSTIKNHSTVPKYLDELVSENNLDEEEQEILHTLFKEVYDYFNADRSEEHTSESVTR